MAKKDKDNLLVDFGESLSKVEIFVEKNQKVLMYILSAVFGLIALYFAAKYLYLNPQETKAQESMYKAEFYFAKDSFLLAFDGDGVNQGFKKIADEYSWTKSGNLANYYAGICCMRLEKFNDAINYLEGFSTSDNILESMKYCLIGDAYLEKNNLVEALDNYEKAAKINEDKDDNLSRPFILKKKAFVLEKQKKYSEALVIYKEILSKHKDAKEARDIEKYITRIELNL